MLRSCRHPRLVIDNFSSEIVNGGWLRRRLSHQAPPKRMSPKTRVTAATGSRPEEAEEAREAHEHTQERHAAIEPHQRSVFDHGGFLSHGDILRHPRWTPRPPRFVSFLAEFGNERNKRRPARFAPAGLQSLPIYVRAANCPCGEVFGRSAALPIPG